MFRYSQLVDVYYLRPLFHLVCSLCGVSEYIVSVAVCSAYTCILLNWFRTCAFLVLLILNCNCVKNMTINCTGVKNGQDKICHLSSWQSILILSSIPAVDQIITYTRMHTPWRNFFHIPAIDAQMLAPRSISKKKKNYVLKNTQTIWTNRFSHSRCLLSCCIKEVIPFQHFILRGHTAFIRWTY